MRKHVYFAFGGLAFCLGLIGVLLPVMPTVPFMILAAALFAKGSPRAHDWLLNNPQFGPHIRRWEQTGGISRRGKTLALVTMAGSVALTLLMGVPWPYVAVQGVCMCGAAIFIVTRPDERGDRV